MPDIPAPRAVRTPTEVRAARFAVGVGVAVVATGVDQASKAEALAQLSTEDRIPLIGDFLGLQLAFNAGTVMSLGSGSTWVLTIVAAAALVIVPVIMFRSRSLILTAGLGFIWGGAAGNFLDRLFAEPGFGVGYVTDFLAYGDLFIGNLADVSLAVGGCLVVASLLRNARAHAKTNAG